MMLIYVLLFAYVQGTTASMVLHNINKLEAMSKCPKCHKSAQCEEKYEMFIDHTACLTKSAFATPIPMTDAEKDDIVNHHNKLRGSVYPPASDMMQLKWGKELEMLARRWAEACKKNATNHFYYDHSRFIPGRYSFGQNIAWGGGHFNFMEITDAWFAEKYSGRPRNSHGDQGTNSSHTQLVWARTTLIGCAAAKCFKDIFYVCNYAPGRNVSISNAYRQSANTGGGCKKLTKDELCDCGDLGCENGAVINPRYCTCECDKSFHDPPHCSLDCSKPQDENCGISRGLMETDCHNGKVIATCPHLCGICPCAAKTYKSVMCSGDDSSSNGSRHSNIQRIFILVDVLLSYALTVRLW